MPGRNCAVSTCKNSYMKSKKEGKSIIYHSFPKDQKMQKLWAKKTGCTNERNFKNCQICSDHFCEDDYERDLRNELLGIPPRKVLKKTAVPSLRLENTNQAEVEYAITKRKKPQHEFDDQMSSSTISTIWKSRDTVKQVFENSPAAKRLRPCNEVLIDKALLKWLKAQMSNDIEVTTTALQEKAKECALEVGVTDFQCTGSWIQRFRKRYKNICGKKSEIVDVPQELSVNWLSTVWPSLRKSYLDDEIYNAVEASCFYGFSSNRSFVTNEINPQIRRDFSKERLTILVAANMTGTDKLKPFVIGKCKECFFNSLLVDYEYHPKGSINSNIFERIIKKWDDNFYQQKKKILLLLDKSSMRLMLDDLEAIEVVFLPTNIKSPFKTGKKSSESVIITVRNDFRSLEIKKFLENIDNSDTPKQINIVEACDMISTAWNNISQSSISNSFITGGFNVDAKFQECSNEPLPIEVCLTPSIKEEFMEEDNEIKIKEENEISITENQIIPGNSIKIKDEVDSEIVPPTLEDAAFAIQTLRNFFTFNQGSDYDRTTSAISYLENLIEDSKVLNKM
nr:tigger transposable element-derived protein 4-like isoform X1 [Onthophagus taurus]XP_022914491.1 tigger transposable element-derived protein 4-like isoform X1 [Onthophagus taurus]XP_022914492.1 tigger transposable element-derived protein 4-like isoform X1 [Onthophagus taurus]XP_022914494.1 tigger transposable element-derived protein 4-like isoform X2 [Onthophagus taurus]XP_022914495.1 tigger transposable element-derived protein 4-like isoform X2 [Onthophagus taurus]